MSSSITKELVKKSFTSFPKQKVFLSDSVQYVEAIKALNSLQSNAHVIEEARIRMLNGNVRHKTNVDTTLKYVKRLGLCLEELEPKLIHISGTKGKGSTATMTEALLRSVPYKTGLFLSPHITSVRERIMINGQPLSQQIFVDYFWSVYNELNRQKENESDMPAYFKFLTIMALKVFISERVDVAILEVGIGGESDCTNVFTKTPVVGIASIGHDHTKMLGETLEKIAWQKAGIMKPGCIALTVPDQSPSVLKVFRERAAEKKCRFEVVPNLSDYHWDMERFGLPQRLNGSLAFQLAKTWTVWNNNGQHLDYNKTEISKEEEKVLINCSIPGRCQILRNNSHNIVYYLDGAHTIESIDVVRKWFQETSPNNVTKILVFNVTGGRSATTLLQSLVKCQFSYAIFCTNYISENIEELPEDLVNKAICLEKSFTKAEENLNAWKSVGGNGGHVVKTVTDAISLLEQLSGLQQCSVLFTGSLHLVGAALFLLRPNT